MGRIGRTIALAGFWVALAPTLTAPQAREPSRFVFTDVAAEAGLDWKLLAGRPDKDHLLDSAGAGAAWLDYDRDGHPDLYLVNGWKLSGDQVLEKGSNALFRNRGDGTFENVTERAGVADRERWGSGAFAADYDGDGWTDLLVTNFGPNSLFRNRGDGTFENVAARAGIECPGWNTGAAFFDADGDGDLDLYIAAYIEASLDDVLKARPTLDWKGVAKVAEGPFGLTGALDHFFLSDGKGGFTEATESAGLTDRGRGYGFAVRAADFDGDGDVDLYVANDSDANYFYRNRGDGTFEETGLWNGAALDADGNAQAGMGLAAGDADGDGVPDVFVTNFSEDFSTLYRGLGGGFFEDVSLASGVGKPTYSLLSWGAALADLDNDGDLDLVVANGHIYPQVDRHPELGQRYAQSNTLLENLGQGRFRDASVQAGAGFQILRSSRGLAVADYDNDGDLDLLFTNLDEAPTLLRNDSATGAWLRVVCETDKGVGCPVGTVVSLTAGGATQRREVASGDSFLSTHDPRPHFGLGTARKVERLEVVWPGGAKTVLEGLEAGREVRVRKP